MPSVAEIEAIETTLKASLGRSKELDQNVASASQRVLLQSIKFIPADKPHSLQLSSLKSKYILLKTNKGEHPQKPLQAGFGRSEHDKAAEMSVPGPSGDAGMGDSLPSPRVVIYPPERIRLEWRQMHKIGGGLVNLGNTCFMNSILQCLTYTAPLVNYCFSDEHPNTCQQQSFCLMCELRRHIKLALHNCGTAFKPNSILQKLKFIAKHFKYGKQEDAHEFLRYLVDGLQRACLNGYAKLDKFSKETTVINQIFGGFLRSQVQCMKCSARSNTYDPFMDLSLDIKGVYTLEDALAKYIKTETLDSDNAYKCEKCQQKVPAQKRFSIHKAPNVLTVQLNSKQESQQYQMLLAGFDYNRMAGKINRHIQFPEKLNIRPYMSQKQIPTPPLSSLFPVFPFLVDANNYKLKEMLQETWFQGEPVYYHLYGVLIHQGNHCSMGHYYCYVKAPSNVWYVMNDSMVHTVSSNRVFQAEAYLLFYTKAVGNHHQIPSKGSFSGPNANGIVTPKFNGVINKQASIGTAVSAKANNDLGVPIPRQMSPIETPQTTFSGSSAVASLPPKHNKISFGIAPKPFQSAQKQNTAGGNSTSSPRIVMQIKNGKVTTIEKSPDGKSKVVKCSSSRQSTLVPYDDDSESGGEGTSRDMAKKSNNKGPRVALNFRDQEKEKHVHENVSNFAQGAFMSSGSSTLPKNASQKDKIENTVEGPHIVGSLTAVKHGGTDGTVPHLDLMLNRDSSGLKKMAIDTQSTTKINATSTSWFVQAKDSVPSPSLGSCSSNNSNHSVNSTTEWTVEPEGKTKSSLEKKQSPSLCWKVTTSPVKERKGFLLRSESLEDKQKPVKKVKRSSSVEPLSLWNKPVLSNGEEHHSLDGFQTTAARRTGDLFGAKMDDSASVGCNSVQALSSSDNVNGIVRLAFAACASHSKDGDETLEQNGHHSGEEMKPLLQQDDCFSSQKAHKKHKKKKRKRDKDGEKIKVKYSQLQESVISEDAEPRRKHKKKKHKRDRDCFDSDYKEKRHRDLDESDSDHKRKRYSSYCDLDGEGQSARKRRRSESSDSEYTWEERTKETLLNKKSETAVPVQGWDDYVQDNLGKGTKQDKNNCLESRLLWDGSKKSHVLEDLQRRPSVMSWDGEKSKAGTEAEEEERRRNRKSWFERYEEDIDRGKVKKVKKRAHEIPWAFNPFQKHQNIKNQERDKWRDNYDSHHKPQNSGCSPSLGRSYSDQTSYRHFSGSQYHHDHYNRSNSTNSHHVSFHRSQSHQSYQKRH